MKASEDLQGERVEQVKFGSTLEQDLIDSRAQLLQAKQEILTNRPSAVRSQVEAQRLDRPATNHQLGSGSCCS